MTADSFDDRAATWDDSAKIERARAVAAAIGRAVPLEPSMTVLEYGAGTGLVSQFLADSVGAVTLADPSAGMRAVALGKVRDGALPATTRVWDLDLESADAPSESFDLIVVVMALHHVANLSSVFAGFASMLAPGGRVCLVDLEEEDGSFHADPALEVHHGFGERQLLSRLAGAGFDTVLRSGIHDVVKDGRAYPLFLAVCTRPHAGHA